MPDLSWPDGYNSRRQRADPRRRGSVAGTGVLLDPVNLIPHSPEWLRHWDRQLYLYITRQDLHAIDQCPVDALSAVIRAAGDNPNLLVSTVAGRDRVRE